MDLGNSRPNSKSAPANEIQRAELLAAFASSGLDPRAFAEREGINFTTLTSWLAHECRAAEDSDWRLANFENSPTCRLEVTLPGRIVVHGNDPTALANLVHRLGKP